MQGSPVNSHGTLLMKVKTKTPELKKLKYFQDPFLIMKQYSSKKPVTEMNHSVGSSEEELLKERNFGTCLGQRPPARLGCYRE